MNAHAFRPFSKNCLKGSMCFNNSCLGATCDRERERERERQTDRQTDRQT